MAKTPMMQQYDEAKQACGDALLLFRMGDFYELFYDDAKIAAKVLGLTLTSRDKGENPIPMAGFPHHQLEQYLGKLIRAGQRAAVCDQVEDPKQAKGIVRREVTRVVTAGTLTDDALLDPKTANYLCSIVRNKQGVGLAWAELSTGQFLATTTTEELLADHLGRILPSEVVVSEDDPLAQNRNGQSGRSADREFQITTEPAWVFGQDHAFKLLCKHFATSTLEGFGFDEETDKPAITAAGGLLHYLQESQSAALVHFHQLLPFNVAQTLEIDRATRRSLELTRTMREGRREGSLLEVLDETVTAMGSRLLSDWLAAPLRNQSEIEQRHTAVEELLRDAKLRETVREELKGIYDLQRLLARVATLRAAPRDLKYIERTLGKLPRLKSALEKRKSPLIQTLEANLDPCEDLRQPLELALVDDCPMQAKDGGIIKPGYNEKLDELRELAAGGKKWIARYQAAEVERLGFTNLKVGYNRVFGYYMEISNAQKDKIPENYKRVQTLKNAERYVTPELKEYEEKVVSADEQAKELEYDLFVELRTKVHAAATRLNKIAFVLAHLDVLVGLAELAYRRGYVRPQLGEEPVLQIRDGRHPVLDKMLPQGEFVPNDTELHPPDAQVLLITGPNMAGKSTYIRQVALLTIMAQIGSFVPAAEAKIGICDRVFARVGASDELSRGQSTFMVEMTEAARILNTATDRSLVILDEIGRGTSTYDGVSLAWAMVEFLHDELGCRTLFATHYHELTDLAKDLKGVANYTVAVKEWDEEIIFLHKILPGAADKSYGIHVARLAGIPGSVNERAKQILNQLEAEHLDSEGKPKVSRQKSKHPKRDLQLTLFAPYDHPLIEEIRETDLNSLTPLDALNLIQKWKRAAEEDQ